MIYSSFVAIFLGDQCDHVYKPELSNKTNFRTNLQSDHSD